VVRVLTSIPQQPPVDKKVNYLTQYKFPSPSLTAIGVPFQMLSIHLVAHIQKVKGSCSGRGQTLGQTKSPQPMTILRCSVQQSSSVQTNNTPPIIVQDTDDNLMGMDKVKAGARRHQQ
jgi:hypothetical protein